MQHNASAEYTKLSLLFANEAIFKIGCQNTNHRRAETHSCATCCTSLPGILICSWSKKDQTARCVTFSSEFRRNSPDQGEWAQTCRLASAMKAFNFAHKRTPCFSSHTVFTHVAEALPAGLQNMERSQLLHPSTSIVSFHKLQYWP